MKQYFVLDKVERLQEWILIVLFFVTAATIGTGIYFISHKFNHNNI